MTIKSGTEKMHVLVLVTGETLELDVIDIDTNFGCDPMNSADKLQPDARYFLNDVRPSRHEASHENSGLSLDTLHWLDDYFQAEDPNND